jgi:riboflavin kinase
MHVYEHDFYGEEMKVIVLGYIRPEYDYVSKGCILRDEADIDALIEDIKTDIAVAKASLDRPAYTSFQTHNFWNENHTIT